MIWYPINPYHIISACRWPAQEFSKDIVLPLGEAAAVAAIAVTTAATIVAQIPRRRPLKRSASLHQPCEVQISHRSQRNNVQTQWSLLVITMQLWILPLQIKVESHQGRRHAFRCHMVGKWLTLPTMSVMQWFGFTPLAPILWWVRVARLSTQPRVHDQELLRWFGTLRLSEKCISFIQISSVSEQTRFIEVHWLHAINA